ncbi:hypothetical protein [Sphingobium aromaticivastans]|uniref:hypothetical protein n=1 Tax=Sphingobium aromaticivastans TaxID=1778665 RepID=UPI0030184A8E
MTERAAPLDSQARELALRECLTSARKALQFAAGCVPPTSLARPIIDHDIERIDAVLKDAAALVHQADCISFSAASPGPCDCNAGERK